jgi:hypothetical protein
MLARVPFGVTQRVPEIRAWPRESRVAIRQWLSDLRGARGRVITIISNRGGGVEVHNTEALSQRIWMRPWSPHRQRVYVVDLGRWVSK